ncbi:MAG: [protein-PII] uridylyltransferase [Ignavibacteria bacterium]|nr:[protein-PII] uridylyltransferase [Ignavibacteria bacterium]
MNTTALELKRRLAGQRQAIAAAHRSGAGGFDTCMSITTMMDEALRTAWSGMSKGAGDHAAVVALGGYGRSELSPGSDVDVMILCDSGDYLEQAEKAAREFLHILWDAGIDLGHAVRTIDEAAAQHGESHQVWAGMLESRPVCGNRDLSDRFLARLQEIVETGDSTWFVTHVLQELRGRHQRYGNSVKLLEPNVKKSAGAMRDLHTALWLFRATDPEYLVPSGEDLPALRGFLRLLVGENLLDKERAAAADEAASFLLRVRHEMHYQNDGVHDMLEYRLQLQIAEALRFEPEQETAAVEVFMRRYYAHARTIDHLTRRLCRGFRLAVEGTGENGRGTDIGSVFRVSGRSLQLRPGIERLTDPHQVFEAFLTSAENDLELDFRLQGAIESAHPVLDANICTDATAASMFRRILRSGRVGQTLRMMNELNVLGPYIPEFGKLVAFFQHNVYHYFTADEHTLIAVAKAESLGDGEGVLPDVYRSLERKDFLAMAVVLHDIAKPISVVGHETLGVDVAQQVLERIGMTEGFPLVAFLIRNHLLMEQIAFRRNIHDPQTIRDFAARFDSPEQLDYLYVLTYADLSAVNMSVWTEWKAAILRNLYLRTAEILQKKLSGPEIDRLHESQMEEAVEQVVSKLSTNLPGEDVRRHLEGIGNDAYISQFNEREIADHIREGSDAGTISTLFRHGDGFTEVTVIGTDAPYVLSQCCGVLSANDANIFDANIFTRDDGVFIDHFRVSDRGSGGVLSDPACAKIGDDIRHVLAQKLDIRKLFAAHRRKWKRRAGMPLNPTTRIGVEFEENPRFTIIDIFAPDSVGFLYRVTEAISGLGLDIHFAKIATRIDGVVDAFYVRDAGGAPLSPGERREEIRERLIQTIQEIAAEQLSEEDPGKGSV